MSGTDVDLDDTGLEVTDLDLLNGLRERPLRAREPDLLIKGIMQISDAFLDSPDTILQALVDTAAELCGADSAGISFEVPDGPDDRYWRWAAVAGEFAPLANSALPRHPSACGVCLSRNRPQLLRVTDRFYQIIGIEALPVTDGLLLPWKVDGSRGTIWVLAHGRREAFDAVDLETMQSLCTFAALAWSQRYSPSEQPREVAALGLAVELARQVNRQLNVRADVLDLTNAIGVSRRTQVPAEQSAEHRQRLDGLLKLLRMDNTGNQVH